MDLKGTIERIKGGDLDAFTGLVKQFQNLAFAYAFSILKDFHRAQDVVQEAFVVAYYQISQIQDPEAFPGWLKGIVHNQCHRQFRSKMSKWESLEKIEETADENLGPDLKLSHKEDRLAVLQAIDSLPDRQREVVSLFYIEENSQQDVATFLETSVSDVNNCLHAARKTLKRRMNHMVDQTFKSEALPKDFAEGIGKIIKVQGRLVDAEMDLSLTPVLFDDLNVGKKSAPKLTIVQRLKNGRVRCLIHGETASFKPEAKVKMNEEKSFPSLGEDAIKEAILGIGTATNENPTVFETGIKVIDLLCPFPKKGNIGLIGGTGAGRSALVAEMYKKFLKEDGKLSLFFFVSPHEAFSISAMIEREPDLTVDEGGPLQTAWLITSSAAEPDFAKAADYLDARPVFSPVLAVQGRWPAVDPISSSSRLLDASVVGEDHYSTALQVRALLEKEDIVMKDPVFFEYLAVGAKEKARARASTFPKERIKELSHDEKILVLRARKLRNFFTQPFFATAGFTKIKGVSVSLNETIEICKMILAGALDDLPDEAFLYVGGLDEIQKKAHAMARTTK